MLSARILLTEENDGKTILWDISSVLRKKQESYKTYLQEEN